MRYIWDRFDDYFPRAKPLRRAAALSMAPWLRRWDVKTSDEVTQFIANSMFVRDRIKRFYGRDAEVIHPFVDDAFLNAGSAPSSSELREDHLIVSALVPYKRVELAIEAVRGSDRRLVIIGGGPMLEELRAKSGPNVELLGSVSRDRIIERLARAKSLILPGVEDFGITPLEAMALGTPVVALGEGGVLDSVVEGVTGIFFRDAEVESLRRALDDVESRQWDRDAIRARAASFSRARFDAQLAAALERLRE
jgi:glycosyltransferase involved in cell wall biosynthesis